MVISLGNGTKYVNISVQKGAKEIVSLNLLKLAFSTACCVVTRKNKNKKKNFCSPARLVTGLSIFIALYCVLSTEHHIKISLITLQKDIFFPNIKSVKFSFHVLCSSAFQIEAPGFGVTSG